MVSAKYVTRKMLLQQRIQWLFLIPFQIAYHYGKAFIFNKNLLNNPKVES